MRARVGGSVLPCTSSTCHDSGSGRNVETVDNRSEIKEFLMSRRAKITPDEVGLTSYGQRRVPGLRRDEVAQLAGMSVDYYNRLERGNLSGVSESVLAGLVTALRLDEVEQRHLTDLMRAANTTVTAARRRPAQQPLRASVQRVMNSMGDSPVVVQNGRLDIVASNPLGYALHSDFYDTPGRTVNYARFIFLDPRGKRFFQDWDRASRDTVALLRAEAGLNPFDRQLSDLVGELSTRSDEFRTLWAAHNVHRHKAGAKHLRHPVVGELTLNFDVMELPAEPGLQLVAFSAEPGTPSHDALTLLAAFSATLEQNQTSNLPS